MIKYKIRNKDGDVRLEIHEKIVQDCYPYDTHYRLLETWHYVDWKEIIDNVIGGLSEEK